MADAKTLRVIIDGRGLDLMNAFQQAKMSDWKALLASTGRNPFTVSNGLDALAPSKEELALPADEQAAASFARLAGKAGAQLMDTIADLVFLARRLEGDKSAEDATRRISYDQVCDELSFMDALGAMSDMPASETVEEDPTRAPTGSALGESNGDARAALTASAI
jgi:hypothetical protein